MESVAFFHWTANPEIFRFGGFAIRWYGVLFALGFIVGYQILHYFFKKEKQPIKELESLVLYLIIGVVVGARLGHCFFYEPDYYLRNPIEILMIWRGGLASHGGGFGIILALWIFSLKHKKLNMRWLLDRLGIAILPGSAFIRIGNFFNHEILGKPTDLPWAIVFNVFQGREVVGTTPPVHPTQLYEALAYIILFVVFIILYKRKLYLREGLLLSLFLILVFTVRFLLEFTKAPQTDFEQFLPLSMGQILSIPFILAGIILLIRSFRRQKISNIS
ncbi:MAG: prolipoprotein diacylglyceryl transferase [Ignavibacteria bacterium]|nr:prolipoprotein diacylglyceryl transferase [Ignavibacteria bacterium]